MSKRDCYPQFHVLFEGYLNQDYDHWGETLVDVVACFVMDSSSGGIEETLFEIEKFKRENFEDLDGTFYRCYGFNFNPKLWGYTTA